MDESFLNKLFAEINNGNNFTIKELESNMSSYQKEIFNKFKEDKNFFKDYSLNDLLFDFDKKVIGKLLTIELELYQQECLNSGIYNKKNGSTKDIDLVIGNRNVNFNRPRLRYEKDFNSCLIPKRTRIIKDLSDNIILLYSKNNSVNDIKDILKKMFNIDLSNAFISKLTQTIAEDVLEWRNKQLKKIYFCLNIDCTYITLKDEKHFKSHKVPIYVAVGTGLDGIKEIAGIYLGNEDENKNIIDSLYQTDISESKTFWLEVFNDLKDRGLEKVLYVSSDGVTGIKDAIKDEFPSAYYQRCVVHLVKNLGTYCNKSNKAEIIKDFKNVYSATSKDMAILNKEYFLEKYKENKTIIKHASEYFEYIMPLFDIPINIRNYIYTNNIVESVNSKIKRGFYGRGALPNVQSAINIVYLNLKDLEDKWMKKKVNNWDKIYKEVLEVHYNDIKDYL